MPSDLIQICHNGVWQHALVVGQDDYGVFVELNNGRHAYVVNGSWGLLF